MADITINFRGEVYTIPDSRAFEAGDKVEDVARLPEVLEWRLSPHYHKMARAMAVLLRMAGAKVTDREVHSELMASVMSGGENEFSVAALFGLIGVLMDGAPQGSGDSGNAPSAS